MNTIVTGGAGFIGSHLVERLLKDGNSVTVIDNFSTGKEENLEVCEGSPGLRIIRADISSNSPSLFDAFALGEIRNIDCVFHLAGIPDAAGSIEKPSFHHLTHVDGTFAMLEAARIFKANKFVYAASASCYGNQWSPKAISESEPIDCQTPYALTKAIGEAYIEAWHSSYKLPYASLRLFNVYGPRMHKCAIADFVEKSKKGAPLPVFGGNQTRDFVHVRDVVDAFVRASHSSWKSLCVNIGTGIGTKVSDVAELISDNIQKMPANPNETEYSQANILKAIKTLGWSPKISLEEGIKELMK